MFVTPQGKYAYSVQQKGHSAFWKKELKGEIHQKDPEKRVEKFKIAVRSSRLEALKEKNSWGASGAPAHKYIGVRKGKGVYGRHGDKSGERKELWVTDRQNDLNKFCPRGNPLQGQAFRWEN